MVMFASPKRGLPRVDLAHQVQKSLSQSDPLRYSKVLVRGLYCSIVELDGVVPSNDARLRAVNIARRVPGVMDVIDLIRVVPPGNRCVSSDLHKTDDNHAARVNTHE